MVDFTSPICLENILTWFITLWDQPKTFLTVRQECYLLPLPCLCWNIGHGIASLPLQFTSTTGWGTGLVGGRHICRLAWLSLYTKKNSVTLLIWPLNKKWPVTILGLRGGRGRDRIEWSICRELQNTTGNLN